MPATLQEIKDKLTEYETAITDRLSKQEIHQTDQTELANAITAEEISRTSWLAALAHEHVVEDQLEALVVDHEPPAIPVSE